ncbi:MAG: AgmX/PglI C-terminal domain-containing protein [Bdellovibrionaceae bacterium]|nr:AgmX/PglI C-terminal domain-containing protein [Pseudobdellovibrionaceae bacterium]
MKEGIVLKKESGEIIRIYDWPDNIAYVSFNKKTGRLGLHKEQQSSLNFVHLGTLDKNSLKSEPKVFLNIHFSLLGSTSTEKVNLERPLVYADKKISRTFKRSAMLFFFCLFFIAYFSLTRQEVPEEVKEKTEVVKIEKKEVIKPRYSVLIVPNSVSVPVVKRRSVRRLGALAVLGALKTGKQKGGLNLNFSKTSSGVGLGGSQGSGGAQTSLYAKGLSKVALGVGGKITGAGGYGKAGAGGGKAGVGRLSLIGSRGVSSLEVGRESITSGGLDKSAIAAVIQAHLSEVRFCYEKALQGQPDLKGRVVVNFAIEANGLVKLANIKASSLNFPSVEFCIVNHLKSWKFPYPSGGVVVKVSYPFVLQRSN